MNDLYSIKQELINLAGKLFTHKDNKLTKNINLQGKFDFISSEIYGTVGLSPQELLELENLNYQKNEQGRDYFTMFLTIAIQCGVYFGIQQKQKEIDSVTKQLEEYKHICSMYDSEVVKLQLNQMGNSEPEVEILKEREKNQALQLQIFELQRYEHAVKRMYTSLNFDVKRV